MEIFKNFYLTFGWGHPLKDGYILVKARDKEEARMKVVEQFRQKWANLYTEEVWDDRHFPDGEKGVIE